MVTSKDRLERQAEVNLVKGKGRKRLFQIVKTAQIKAHRQEKAWPFVPCKVYTYSPKILFKKIKQLYVFISPCSILHQTMRTNILYYPICPCPKTIGALVHICTTFLLKMSAKKKNKEI